ncbi:hypothetical protein Pcac1_g1005 [Phytophthora cactorum]|nr:hypothetical protein Pcac1_g1005 [Phytophthora cactorum]KAG3163649.1 hypothetical protein PC128_g20343 [Phytophthora cactorum]
MGHYRRVLAQVPDNMIPNLKPQSSALKEDITRVCGWVRPDNTEAGAKVEVVDTISPEKVAAAIAELEAGRYPDTVDEGTTSVRPLSTARSIANHHYAALTCAIKANSGEPLVYG